MNNTELTTNIVKAYVTNNTVPASELASLIASVHDTVENLGKPVGPDRVEQKPAVPIKKSVTHDYLISLETGGEFKSLKKHLGSLGMTPERYRRKWGLPHDYPMVAPAYAERRSKLAKELGLGRKRTAH